MSEMVKGQSTKSRSGRGLLLQPADFHANKAARPNDDSYIQQRKSGQVVSCYGKPVSPSIESSLCDRRQRLIQKRAKVFQSTEILCQSPKPSNRSMTPTDNRYSSVLNLTEYFEPLHNEINVQSSRKPSYKPPKCLNNDIAATFFKANASLQAGIATFGCAVQAQLPTDRLAIDFDNDNSRKVSQGSTTADEESSGIRSSRKNCSSSGVRAKIARRKKMKDANAMDNIHGSLSDQEATSEAYDEDDSVEEKQDSEPMNDWQSKKAKSPHTLISEDVTSNSCLVPPDMTPETARKSWNSRFSNIKHSFNAASEEELSNKSRSPSVHTQDTMQDRSRSLSKDPSRSPLMVRGGNGNDHIVSNAQSKEQKEKENSLKASSLVVVKKSPVPEASNFPKSKQPTPSRESLAASSLRATKSLPRDTSFDGKSRAEVLGQVRSGREDLDENIGSSVKSHDMDYQEYMSIISKVRKTKEFSRVRAEHYKLASMYAKEKKRQEELQAEEDRLKWERLKVEADVKTRPQPLPIMPVYPMVQQKPKTSSPIIPMQISEQPSGAALIIPDTKGQFQDFNQIGEYDINEDQSLNSSQQSLGEEKGQLDKIQTEQKKLSPSPTRKMVADESENKDVLEEIPQQGYHSSVSDEKSSEMICKAPSAPDTEVIQEQGGLHQIEEEHERQQEIQESLIRAEQEKLQKLREEQIKQEKEREEIKRLEIERLLQIQEEQRQLEEERRRQEEHIRLEQLRIEEERKRQEKLQAEKNAEYNKQRLEMEAKTVAMNEGQRAVFDPRSLMISPQEKILQERLMQQERLRQDHRKEESQIRQEKLKLIQQEELLIARQEDMLNQIEAERENLAKQEQLIRKRQQERLQQVRQEKLLLEKQEEMIKIREEQLEEERKRQVKLRQEQQALKEQEEAIRRRQEQISKELMSANMIQRDDILSEGLYSTSQSDENSFKLNSEPLVSSGIYYASDGLDQQGNELEDNDEILSGSGSGSGSDTLDEDGCYECKVEVKQQHTLVPKTVRTIESTVDRSPWAPVTPYLTYSESQGVQAHEEVNAIFSESKSFAQTGVITSPESLRTSTNLITTPESSLSLQSQLSVEPRSLSSSCTNSPPAQVPPLPLDELEVDSRKCTLDVPAGNDPSSPKIGGPGSAFKPYASSENLFDPGLFQKMPNQEVTSIIFQNAKNYPLQNGNAMDSRYFMKSSRELKMNPKIRELKKPVRPPFSTTDTEPEMKECNLSAFDKRRGKLKPPVYSTSETEEEYQAYLRCKPKWHGKSGHKDSWDPLQIQSPPQITQKPVGVIQKPKAQPASQSIERGSQIGATPIYMPPQAIEFTKMPNAAQLPPLPEKTQSKQMHGNVQLHSQNTNPILSEVQMLDITEPFTSVCSKPQDEFKTSPNAAFYSSANLTQEEVSDAEIKDNIADAPMFNEIRIKQLQETSKNMTCDKEPESLQYSKENHETSNNVKGNEVMSLLNESLSQEASTAIEEKGLFPANVDPLKKKSPTKNTLLKKSEEENTVSSSKDDLKAHKKTTAQQRLQQKLMTEALQKVEIKKERSKQFVNAGRPNPTIAAMEIMTRKELKAGEMEQRLARGEIPDIPIPPTPENFKKEEQSVSQVNHQSRKTPQKAFFESLASESRVQKQNVTHDSYLKRSESMKMEKPMVSPKPQISKRLSQENIGNVAPVILLKKQPKRLDLDEIKARQASIEKQHKTEKVEKTSNETTESKKSQEIKRHESSPYSGKKLQVQKSFEERCDSEVSKPKDINVEKISATKQAVAKNAALASTVPKMGVSQRQSLSKAEIAFETVVKEKQMRKELLAIENSPSYCANMNSTNLSHKSQIDKMGKRFDNEKKSYKQSKSKSIGSNLAMKLQMSVQGDDEVTAKKMLPWATDHSKQQRHTNTGIRKHLAQKEKDGYTLRMSKSSDSITAAKLLAESRLKHDEAQNLKINRNMSKSIERQLDVYSKTREDIRKILDAAKSCSVQERIKLFDNQRPFEEPIYTSREEKALAIRREILEAKAKGDHSSETGDTSCSEIQIQSPVEVKVKPLRIPMKPKLLESETMDKVKESRSEPGSKLRINQPATSKTQEIKSILRTSTSLDRSRKESAELSVPSTRTSSAEPKSDVKPKSILVKKKNPKLLHDQAPHNSTSQVPSIYAQSATDISAGEDEDSELRRKSSIPLTINTKAQFLDIPREMSGIRKSKSFASSGQYESHVNESEISAKQRTIMAYFDATLSNAAMEIAKPAPGLTLSSGFKNSVPQVVKRTSASSIIQKRGSIASISDEILGEDDLKDVDAVFESLLNSTFQEIQTRGRQSSSNRSSKKRSVSSHPSMARPTATAAALATPTKSGNLPIALESADASTGLRRGTVVQKQAKNKPKAGELKSAVIIQSDKTPPVQRNSEAMPNKEILADPIGHLPTSQGKRHFSRQQTWANSSPPPSQQSPSPTQSEYDTCPDPWEDY